jgi:hypothetical protein
VPNGVCVIGTGCLEKLLKVISGLSCQELEITLSSGNELLIGVTNILVIVTLVIAGSDHDSLGPPLWPPFIAFGAPLHTLTEGHFPTVLYENGPGCLLARGMPGGDVEELLHGLWLVMAELMHQGSVVRDRPEC